MAAVSNVQIQFEIEPVVKVFCVAKTCKNNLFPVFGGCCNLKHIKIGRTGKCESFIPREEIAVKEPKK